MKSGRRRIALWSRPAEYCSGTARRTSKTSIINSRGLRVWRKRSDPHMVSFRWVEWAT